MVESEIAERIAVRRAEPDTLENRLVKQLEQVRAGRDELAIAERVGQRMAEQLVAETAAEPAKAQQGSYCWVTRARAVAAGPAPGVGPGMS
ncbi:hypothetical protein [Streptomyces sp. HPF1205]|uniref:hypothetical protein n=1 Tax=Streptomyces sp. HPF1205 TaxID=2873262 RepID=UPI001CED2B57|nr:hypothetical protein [Streptomyces sp. HPF1205]